MLQNRYACIGQQDYNYIDLNHGFAKQILKAGKKEHKHVRLIFNEADLTNNPILSQCHYSNNMYMYI